MSLPPKPPPSFGPDDWPHERSDDSLAKEVQVQRPRPRKRWRFLLASALIVGLGATGAYSWKAFHELAELRIEGRDLADALELHRASVDELDSKLTTCERDLTDTTIVHVQRDQHATQLEIALDTCQSSLDDLSSQQEEVRARLGEFESLTSQFQRMIDTGQLDVVFRRGQMIVQLPAAILFPSGSAEISESGDAALAEVAGILRAMPRRRFTVAGHTDNVPVGNAPFDSNWDLSTSRAVAVTEALIRHGMRPGNLVAAGFGEYAPIASNQNPRGRQQNRRIEIILEPDLSPVLRQRR
jgi:chemotaxis protein MotB